MAGSFGGNNAVNSGITATAYAHVSAIPYSNANVANSMYSNTTPAARPKGNQANSKPTMDFDVVWILLRM